MRRKIAYKKKKECVKMGAIILENDFERNYNGKEDKKRGYFIYCIRVVDNFPCGCVILGYDELDAYNMLLHQIKNNEV